MTAQQCGMCGSEVADQAQVCAPCTGALRRNLRELPALAYELGVTMSRQDQLAAQADGGRSAEQPLYWKIAAADALRLIRAGLRQWVELYTGAEHADTDHPAPVLARLLLNYVDVIRESGSGPQMATAMRAAVREARRVIDKPPDRVYLGPCGLEDGDEALCREELFARIGDETVTCFSCGAEHSADHRRSLLLGQVEDQNVPATTVAGVLVTHMGVTVTTSMIRGYEHRGRLVSKGKDRAGRKLFRVGDVMDVLANVGDDRGFNVSA